MSWPWSRTSAAASWRSGSTIDSGDARFEVGFVPDPIRVATLAPAGVSERLYTFLRELNSSFKPIERPEYLPEWPGFQTVFGVRMRAAGGNCHAELDPELEQAFASSLTPHTVLADRIVRAIQSLESRRDDFDVLFIRIARDSSPAVARSSTGRVGT